MKIGIDISQIVYKTGVSHYRENLVKNLLKIDLENEYVLFGGSLRRLGELKQMAKRLSSLVYGIKSKWQSKLYPFPPGLADFIWNRLHILPVEKLVGKIDVFHSSDWSEPPSSAFKVTTVHDLIPINFPRITHPKIVAVHQAKLKWVKKEVDRVIVPSLATKIDLVDYGVKKEIIRIIPEAANCGLVSEREVDRVKRKFRIYGKYLLAVGVNPRKNIERIIEAFHLARPGLNLKLIIVGEPTVTKIEEQRDIRLLGQVSDSELSALYTGAEVLVFPSLAEGFGVPILDAFACSCPVVTSNLSAMPEVAGEAAVLVDPYSVGSIAEGIRVALRGRKGLIEKGLKRVKQFSWQKTAQETLKVYQESK